MLQAQFALDDTTPGGMPVYRLSLAITFVTKAFWRTVAHFVNPDAIPSALRHAMLAPVRDHTDEYRAVQTSDELDICPETAIDSASKSLRHRGGERHAVIERHADIGLHADIELRHAPDSTDNMLILPLGPQQATGEALYLDDYPARHDELHAALVGSSKAHAKVLAVDATAALGTCLWRLVGDWLDVEVVWMFGCLDVWGYCVMVDSLTRLHT